jgi:transcriptional regulator with XRE-family HTH domain
MAFRTMTPARLRACLSILGWSQRELANRAGWSEGAIRQWHTGKTLVPFDVGLWLEMLARFHADHPPPVRQRSSVAARTGKS